MSAAGSVVRKQGGVGLRMVRMVGVRFAWLLWICAFRPIFRASVGFFCSTRGSVHVFTLPPVSVSSSSLAGLELPLRRVNRASALFGEPSTKGNQKQNTDCGFCFIFLSFIFFHLVGEGQCAFVSVKEANFGKYSDNKATVSFSAFAAAVYVLMWNRVSLVHV